MDAETRAARARELTEQGREYRAAVAATRTRELRSATAKLDVRATGNGGLVVEGYASTTEQPYDMYDAFGPYEEVVRSGAFVKTIAEGCDTVLLTNHGGLPLARTKGGAGTLSLSEDDHGLHFASELDAVNPMVTTLRSGMDRGDIDECSFAFEVIRQQWSPDWMQRDMIELSLNRGDVSIVTFGANPTTSVGMRAEGPSARAFALACQELRAGKALSAVSMEVLGQVLDLISTADDAVDEAQPLLADLMGVPNPDDPDEVDDGSGSQEQESAPDLSLYRAKATLLALAR
jgi:HK97 family phage prohead protease